MCMQFMYVQLTILNFMHTHRDTNKMMVAKLIFGSHIIFFSSPYLGICTDIFLCLSVNASVCIYHHVTMCVCVSPCVSLCVCHCECVSVTVCVTVCVAVCVTTSLRLCTYAYVYSNTYTCTAISCIEVLMYSESTI